MHLHYDNPLGRLTGIKRVVNNEAVETLTQYRYDEHGQLSAVINRNGDTVRSFSYADGLMVTHSNALGLGCHYRWQTLGDKPRVVEHWTSDGEQYHFRYDPWGNLIEKRSGHSKLQNFAYDCENRLVKAETYVGDRLESTGQYRYDSLGRRVAKQAEIKGEIEQKRFLWQGLRMLREETPGQSILYLYEPGSYAPLARVDQVEGEGQKVYYFHTDQIGTPLELTDSEGEIVWQATYRSWGEIEQLTVNGVEQNLRFQGQYFDRETALHYNTFRYYDPALGRFVTQDPVGLFGGDNLYQYAKNTQSWIDSLGLACDKWDVSTHQANKNAVKGKNLGLDSHHVGQKNLMKDLVEGYDPATGPAMLVPRVGHTVSKEGVGIVSRSSINPRTGLPFTSARDVVARDIRELRRVYPEVPNEKLQQLIALNKSMYPEMRK